MPPSGGIVVPGLLDPPAPEPSTLVVWILPLESRILPHHSEMAMSRSVFQLTPPWVEFDEFWPSLLRRNRWLIHLRYGAVAMLLAFVGGSILAPHIDLQALPISLLAIAILVYNIAFHRTVDIVPAAQARFNAIHFALLQISADFMALAIFIYLTGGVEGPFYVFFLFHVILGSLILPGRVVALIIALTLGVTLTGAILECNGIIPHFPIQGLHTIALYNRTDFILLHFLTFSMTLYVSFFLANSISRELYLRERSLGRAYHRLQDAEAAKSRYVMSLVHDLKTPIAAAMTYLNMILEKALGPIPDAIHRPLERSQARLSGGLTMINDVLQFSKLKLESRLQTEAVDLNELIQEIYEEMKVLFEARRISFSQWWRGEDVVIIEAERPLLKLALSNVISNACKYTAEGGRVEIHGRVDKDTVVLECADNGIGIPAEELSKVFEDFYRSSISKKKGIEGTGLGTSILLYVVRQHNGSVHVESPSRLNDGGARPGTAFFITLPMVHIPTEHDLEPEFH